MLNSVDVLRFLVQMKTFIVDFKKKWLARGLTLDEICSFTLIPSYVFKLAEQDNFFPDLVSEFSFLSEASQDEVSKLFVQSYRRIYEIENYPHKPLNADFLPDISKMNLYAGLKSQFQSIKID